MSDSQRSSYWDNLKAILIVLVVLGHYLLPVNRSSRSVTTVYYWIYLFHMPAFIFVSGFFAKSYIRRGASDPDRLIGFLVLYFAFVLVQWLLNAALKGSIAMPNLFSPSGAPWYLLCMFLWYLALPLFVTTKAVPGLIAAVVLALLLGTDSGGGAFLALSRCVVFFPFFLAGYHFKGEWIERIGLRHRVPAAILMAGAMLFLFLRYNDVKPYLSIIYADSSYEGRSLTLAQGLAARTAWYLVAAVLTGSLLCLVPRQRMFFTYLGQRTLAIYILHILIRTVLQHIGLYEIYDGGIKLLLLCGAVSLAIVFLCSGKRTSAFFNSVFKFRWTRARRDLS